MNTELDTLAESIQSAGAPEDVFGKLDGDLPAQCKALQAIYRQLARAVHPDLHDNSSVATEAFARLSQLYVAAEAAVKSGSYGKPVLASCSTKRHSYEFTHHDGSIGAANVYRAIMDKTTQVVCRVAQTPSDNDLLRNEAVVLRQLFPERNVKRIGYETMFPDLFDSFMMSQNGDQYQVNVLAAHEDFVRLTDIYYAYPDGVDPRDMAWIWRRILDALGYIHHQSMVNGSMLPSNILVGCGDAHEVILTNWQTAVASSGLFTSYIPAIEPSFEAWYPAGVFRKDIPSPSVDISMAARCMIQLLGGDPIAGSLPASVPTQINNFLSECLSIAASATEAWRLRAQFGDICKSLWGPAAYRPFFMP